MAGRRTQGHEIFSFPARPLTADAPPQRAEDPQRLLLLSSAHFRETFFDQRASNQLLLSLLSRLP